MLRDFPSEVTYNSIFVLSSLAERQRGTTQRILEDLGVYAQSKDIYLFAGEPHSADDFRAFFANIRTKMPAGVGAILHIDMHGSVKEGLHILASNEFISWAELSRLCAQLNLYMRNNLILLLPVCYGQEMLRHVDVMANAPFNVFIGSEQELDAGFIADNFMLFYRDLVDGGNKIASFENVLSKKMIISHSERVFLISIARYFQQKCFGHGGQQRREDLLTEALKRVPNNRQSRRIYRSKIKAHVRPKPEIFERYADKFLCGKKPNFGFVDVLNFARIP